MKKRLKKGICLLVSILMVITSMPMGVLAQEATTSSSPIVNSASPGADSAKTAEVSAPANTAASPKNAVTTEEETQSLGPTTETTVTPQADEMVQTADVIETMATETDGAYSFEVDADGNAVITAYNGIATILTVPETLTTADGFEKMVTTIGAGAFNGCSTLTKVVLPSSLTTIESVLKTGTFAGCSSLTEVTIPANVSKLGPDIFYNLAGPVKIDGVAKSFAEGYVSEYDNLTFSEDKTLFYINNFATTVASGGNIGTAIPLTASAAGGTGTVTYKFYCDLVDNNSIKTTIPILDWSAAATASFTPITAGIYTFYVEAKDGAGKTCIKTINDYKVINTPTTELSISKASPQYIDSSIVLTAGVKTGTGTGAITYEFSSQLGSTKKVIQAFSAVNTCSVLTGTPGVYTYYVTAKDSQGLTNTATITNYSIIDRLNITSFTADKVAPQELGTALKLTAVAAGGKTTCQYHFYYTFNANTTPIDIQDYSENASAVFTPKEAGDYKIYVDAMNASGIPTDPQSIDFKIVDTPEIGSFTATTADDKPFYKGDTSHPITLTADAITGGTEPYTYAFSYTVGTGTVKKPITSTVGLKTTTFEPSEAGTYTFYVDVKDYTNTVTATKTVSNYVVYEPLGGTLTTDKGSLQNKETTVKLTAAGSSGKAPYTYEFSYIAPDNTKIPIGTDSASKTASVLLNDAGDYSLHVTITDANKVEKDVTIPYVIQDNPVITDLKTDRDAEIGHYANDAITVTPKVEGGTGPYTYVFTYKIGTKIMATSTKTAASAAAAVTDTYTPNTAGTYTFEVKVTDNNGLSSTKSITSYKVLTALTAKTLKLDKASGQNIGTAIKLTATANGGKGPYTYCFYYTLDGGVVKKDLSGGTFTGVFGTSSTAAFTPTAAGIYTLYVDIKDANGKLATQGKVENYKVVNAPVIKAFLGAKTLGETATTALYSGDTIKLTAKTEDNSGEKPLTYRFYYKLGSSEFPIKTVTNTNRVANEEVAVDFVLPAAGTYTLFVEVSDGTSKDVANLVSYKVLPGVSAKAVKLSKTTGLIAGDTVKLTATAAGGKAPYTYQFYVKESAASSYTLIGTATTANTISYTLPAAGTDTFYVKITDANKVESGNTTTKETPLLSSASAAVSVANPPVISDKGYTKTGSTGTTLYAGDILKLTAKTTDNTGEGNLTYRFYYKVGSVETLIYTDTKTARGTAEESTADFKLPGAGTYTVFVEVKDAKGSKDTEQIASCKVLGDISVNTVKVSKTTGLIVGDTVKLTATGAGGKTPYSYQFYYKEAADSTYTPIGTIVKTNSISFVPKAAGTYTFYVAMIDANGIKSSNSQTIISDPVTVGNPPVIESLIASPVKGGPVYEGGQVVLTAKMKTGSGVGPLTYTFSYMSGSTITNIDASKVVGNVATFTIEAAGTYTLRVTVSDGTSEATQTITGYKVLTGVSAKSLKADKLSGQNIGTTIKLTAVASGGKAPYTYEFYSINENTVENIIQKYSTSKTANFKPTEGGAYNLYVRVKDANGTVCTNDKDVGISDYKVTDNPIIKDFSTSRPAGQTSMYVDTEIGLTATVTGGATPYHYVFSYKLGTGAPVTLDNTDGDNTATFKPTAPGSYTLSVAVTDKDNNPNPATTKEIKSFTVIAKPTVKSFTVSKTSVVKGSKVTLSSAVTGGQSPYTYEFSYKKPGDTDKTIIRAYSATSSYTWTPDTAGTYTLTVGIKDKYGTETTKDTTLTVTEK
ncbi:triple tyrosine motif-containing protein [Acetobacterium tundrae]|uniref:Leucine-rich repeat protein n=1 Tax=Acetobacterium tundrae TaxID=132932 RepID=A0ABR6WLZ9_9FIRM|nr:triple tyrosine motif-containing protein [Acetobacterium tundrae]MBC3797389.1 leucine-rich repeat protein [Acetobacterium tundrae]